MINVLRTSVGGREEHQSIERSSRKQVRSSKVLKSEEFSENYTNCEIEI
jgi:hypothetical protein